MNNQNRIYCDYNATSPLAPPVKELLGQGSWPMGNPSSVHASGKKARRAVGEVSDYLYKLFGLSETEFRLFFHSGATEGINSIVKGLALKMKSQAKTFSFYTLASDHSCLFNQREFLEILGFQFYGLKVLPDGGFDQEDFSEKIAKDKSDVALLNWTWVNNESGVVNPLLELERVLEKARGLQSAQQELYSHVDAVQAPGKIEDWNKLSSKADSYTFSGHKFGALKGSGFSFVRETLPLFPLLNGGGQQGGLRSGTENSWGIYSLKAALEYMISYYSFEEQSQATRALELKMMGIVGEKGEVIGAKNLYRNGNTIYLLLYGVKAHTSAMVFDMAGIDLSNGSACSSGAVIPSRVLLAMGHSEEEAKSALRFSFGPYFNNQESEKLWPQIEAILKRLLS